MRPLRERRSARAARNRESGNWRVTAECALIVAIAAFACACNRPLPEAHTEAAELYANRCGQCHRAYAPSSLPAAMWEVQVQMMDAKMRQLNVPPLTAQERQTILSYLARNAAHE
jgi:Dihaem cytochrome c